ncbi:Panacea domain-containing protein [Actinotignum sanguinis]|uniref:DUF4065 domain-containing protein n=3 Tax=Actinomycetaceae TaxID=2049 RepID=A0ABZ0RD72_9ACTO|nr:type II toxin-antitoxin system antitoxin SocA domain-containing protein [Actinotignum sanguinis]WPJ88955.1 DUF4065 domain-containing protein [Schaalia turicensis]MDE1656160.1 DUF4065 domain-containing protein [Actinotignum sanguinis]MDK8513457.1 DUF4065 domain-containing protein [Actinotignum sanguinis]MDK8519138.1 DUF4065 domain-containing protein [Actinotignum sanguinis]MDK8749243.1 DUF4065 domain-containing protein [Actinotignum sanguinis]
MSVFDVAHFFVSRSASGSVSAPKLQKLCFYAFGWYGYQTGEALFDNAFYAMESGPAVGDLLTTSACSTTVDQKLLEEVHAAWEEETKEFGPYTSDILEAVWNRYGEMTIQELTRATQQEEPWIEAWQSRPDGAKRAEMSSFEILDYFVTKKSPDFVLPDRKIIYAPFPFEETPTPASFFEKLRDLGCLSI